jgi:hypothetical protein
MGPQSSSSYISTISIANAIAESDSLPPSRIHCLRTRMPRLEYRHAIALARHRANDPASSASDAFLSCRGIVGYTCVPTRIIILDRCLRAKNRVLSPLTLCGARARARTAPRRALRCQSRRSAAWLRRTAVERGCVGCGAARISAPCVCNQFRDHLRYSRSPAAVWDRARRHHVLARGTIARLGLSLL